MGRFFSSFLLAIYFQRFFVDDIFSSSMASFPNQSTTSFQTALVTLIQKEEEIIFLLRFFQFILKILFKTRQFIPIVMY